MLPAELQDWARAGLARAAVPTSQRLAKVAMAKARVLRVKSIIVSLPLFRSFGRNESDRRSQLPNADDRVFVTGF
jgi:hypothetical protein